LLNYLLGLLGGKKEKPDARVDGTKIGNPKAGLHPAELADIAFILTRYREKRTQAILTPTFFCRLHPTGFTNKYPTASPQDAAQRLVAKSGRGSMCRLTLA